VSCNFSYKYNQYNTYNKPFHFLGGTRRTCEKYFLSSSYIIWPNYGFSDKHKYVDHHISIESYVSRNTSTVLVHSAMTDRRRIPHLIATPSCHVNLMVASRLLIKDMEQRVTILCNIHMATFLLNLSDIHKLNTSA